MTSVPLNGMALLVHAVSPIQPCAKGRDTVLSSAILSFLSDPNRSTGAISTTP
ncbi:MAG: hypothetical protein ICV51_03685 [Flavisolibacter sp.]|nr:hypothetical protein [Flavisolibacter sp.]